MTRRWWPTTRAPVETALMLDEAVTALGRRSDSSGRLDVPRWPETVSIDRILGSVARHGDFDRGFRPLTRPAKDRRAQLARLDKAVTQGAVSLVRLGETYFVEDGHHRVSLARARGRLAVDASVRSLCTIAWACACLTRADLPHKAGERDFLAKVPLPDHVVHDLWLHEPTDYRRLADAARAWAEHADHDCPRPDCVIDPGTAAAWWDLEVLPRVHATATAARQQTTPASTAARYLAVLFGRKM